MDNSRIVSGIFIMSRKEFARHLFLLYGQGWLAALLLLLLPALALGIFHDLRWIVILLMIICLLTPMLTAFLYFYHGMRPLTVTNIVPHSVEICCDGITIIIYDTREDDEGHKIYTIRHETHFPFHLFKRYITGYSSIILPLKSPERGFLWLPLTAFTDREDFNRTLRRLSVGIDTNTGINESSEKIYQEHPKKI